MLLDFIMNNHGPIVIPMFEFFGITLEVVCLDIYPLTFVVKLTSFRSACKMLAEKYTTNVLDLT